MNRMTAKRYKVGEKMTRAEVLEAAAEIISLERVSNEFVDEEAAKAVQYLKTFKDLISWPHVIYEPVGED